MSFAVLVDITVQTDILHLADNVDFDEAQAARPSRTSHLQEIISLQYDDDIKQFSETAIREAIAADLESLRNTSLMQPADLSSHQKGSKKAIKTNWAINSRPGAQGPSLKVHFCNLFSRLTCPLLLETF